MTRAHQSSFAEPFSTLPPRSSGRARPSPLNHGRGTSFDLPRQRAFEQPLRRAGGAAGGFFPLPTRRTATFGNLIGGWHV